MEQSAQNGSKVAKLPSVYDDHRILYVNNKNIIIVNKRFNTVVYSKMNF